MKKAHSPEAVTSLPAASDATSLKEKQLKIVLENNPAKDDQHCWIRGIEDILSFEEAINSREYEGCQEFAPDFTRSDATKAVDTGEIVVYSSHEIMPGAFVTPSRMEAENYASCGSTFRETVKLRDVAWIDTLQGQYAPVK